MRELAPRFTASGVRLAVIVQSEPEDLSETCGWTKDLVCVPDPEKVSHRAIGLGRMSGWKILSGELGKSRKRAVEGGFSQSWRRTMARESDWFLVPGAALVERGGRILWLHRGEHVGDLPAAADLLAVAQEHVEPERAERPRS